MADKEDQIKFTLKASLKRRFQMWCLENSRKMSDVLREFIESLVQGNLPTDDSESLVIAERTQQQASTNAEASRLAIAFISKLLNGKQPTSADVVKLAEALDADERKLAQLARVKLENGDKQSNGKT